MDDIFFSVGSFLYNTTNWVSCICGIWILVHVTFLRCFYPRYVNRVSLRLQTIIAIIDVIRHLINIFNKTPGDGCKFIGFLNFFCYHVNTFLNVAIALNLQIIYLQERTTSNHHKSLLYYMPILAALILDFIPLTFNGYGLSMSGRCDFNKDFEYTRALGIVLLYMTNYPGLIYCLIICILVWVKLAITSAIPDPEENIQINDVQDQFSRYIVSRVSLYPMSYFLCNLGRIVASCYFTIFYRKCDFLLTWDLIGTSLVGTVNLLCFLLDPYIEYSWYQIKYDIMNYNSSERTILINSSSSRYVSYMSDPNDAISIQPQISNDHDSLNNKNEVSIPLPNAKDSSKSSNTLVQSKKPQIHPNNFFRTDY